MKLDVDRKYIKLRKEKIAKNIQKVIEAYADDNNVSILRNNVKRTDNKEDTPLWLLEIEHHKFFTRDFVKYFPEPLELEIRKFNLLTYKNNVISIEFTFWIEDIEGACIECNKQCDWLLTNPPESNTELCCTHQQEIADDPHTVSNWCNTCLKRKEKVNKNSHLLEKHTVTLK